MTSHSHIVKNVKEKYTKNCREELYVVCIRSKRSVYKLVYVDENKYMIFKNDFGALLLIAVAIFLQRRE